MKAMILAAGLGTRMRPLTDKLPKPLLPVGDSTLIELHLNQLQKAGISEVVINVSYLADMIIEHLGEGERYGLKIVYSKEQQPLETAGGIQQALPLLKKGVPASQPFIVINGDVWTDYPLARLLEKASVLENLAHLVLVSNPKHHPLGDFHLDAEGKVHVDGQPKYTFSGISLLSPRLFDGQLSSNRLADLFREQMPEQQVSGEVYQGGWMDIGTPQRLDVLRAILN